MSDSLGVSLALGLIKSVVCVYDVVTFPFYFIAQTPWKATQKSSLVKAKQTNPKDPYSPWVLNRTLDDHFIHSCTTVAELFKRVCEEYGDTPQTNCLGSRQVFGEEDEKQPDGKVFKKLLLGDYQWLSYKEVDTRVDHIGQGLVKSGVHPGDNVLLFAETRLEWMLSAQAIFRIGATVATLYATLGDEGIVHGINETEVTHIITNHDLLPKLQRLIPRIPTVRCIIYMEGPKAPALDGFEGKVTTLSFSKMESIGKDSPGARGEAPKPSTTAILMYTSGSTGIPKGVMISHKNLLRAVFAFFTIAHEVGRQDLYMGYLPLAHVLELAAELLFFSIGIPIGYATPLTLTDKSTGIKKGCQGDATLLKPTIMTAVPLILDRIRKGINEEIAGRGAFFKKFFDFAIAYKKWWTKRGYKTPIVNLVICKKIRAMLGGRVRVVACGGAPLSPETHEFTKACMDVIVLQGYGLTETCASATLMGFEDLTAGTVGPPLIGVKIKLADWTEGNYHATDKPNPRGEIVIGGANVTDGYYKNDELTRETFRDEDGTRYFYTGDIGEMMPNGSVKIIDRKKDLVKLPFGEYISLGKVEAELKSSPYVDNICIYGDAYHNYLIGLVVPNGKALKTLADQLGKPHMSHAELCRDQSINSQIVKAIAEHGIKSKLSKTEIPNKIKLVQEEWMPESGLVTAAFKLRRKNIQTHYQKDINRLYADENGVSKST